MGGRSGGWGVSRMEVRSDGWAVPGGEGPVCGSAANLRQCSQYAAIAESSIMTTHRSFLPLSCASH